jgi:3-oxoadipate enol-lactonase
VLVHGLGSTGTHLWGSQIADLAPEARVIAYDLRGSGESEITPGPYTIDLLADDLRSLVDALQLGHVALLAHSLGGSIALAYAARSPASVRALVGVGAPVGFPDQARAGLAARAETVAADGMAAVAATVATNGVSATFREHNPERFQELVAMLAANDPAGYAAQCRALVDLDLAGRLGKVKAPVLFIAGDRDGVSPPAVNEANAALVQDGSRVLVEDCGHILPWENPGALARAAWPFLREHR